MLTQLTEKEIAGLQEIATLARQMGHASFEIKREWLEKLLADRQTMQAHIGDLEKALNDCIDSKKGRR